MNRKSIRVNPLDAALPDSGNDVTPPVRTRVEKERLLIYLPRELTDRLRNAVYWTPGYTVTRLAEEAIQATVEKMEKQQGGPFPQRERRLTGGRHLRS